MSKNDFKILTDRDHILLRPQMYIGSVSEEKIETMVNFQYKQLTIIPALFKIVNEIIDNAVDEAIRTNFKHANKIDISLSDDELNFNYGEFTISDNGRGIPFNKHNEIYQAEAAWTQAKAGTSFTDNRTTIGANGVGSFATNCFSSSFIGYSSDGKQLIEVKCSDSCNPENIETKIIKGATHKKGTKVSFKPDFSLFDYTESKQVLYADLLELIKDRLVNLSICYPIKFTLNDEVIKSSTLKSIAKQFHDDAISFSFGDSKLVISPSGDDAEFRHVSYVNGIHMKNGGSHIDYMVSEICSELQPLIKKKWKIDVLPNQIKQHLIIGFWTNGFNNPKFDSQSKERLTNTVSEVKAHLNNFDGAVCAKKILSTPSIIDPMVEAILYKKELAEKRKAKAALKKASKKKIAKHLVATHKDPMKRNLFIGEGDSAVAGILGIRDAEIHGAYPLRGKIMNTYGLNKSQILQNKELLELMSILGLSIDNSSINDDPDKLYSIVYENNTYIAAKDDIIIDSNGNEVKVADLLKSYEK